MDKVETVEPALTHIASAAGKLREMPELQRALDTYVQYNGLDAYSPPTEVTKAVREIVTAFLILSREPLSRDTESAVVAEARFLVARLDNDLDFEDDADGIFRAYCGHVLPSLERLRSLLATLPTPPEADTMSNTPISTERLEELAAEATNRLVRTLAAELLSLRQQAQPTREELRYAWGLLLNTAEGVCRKLESETGTVTILDQSALRESISRVRALKSDAPAREAGGEVLLRPLDTRPSGPDALEPDEVSVHEGAWALVIGTNGKPAAWIDTHAMFAHRLYRDQILSSAEPAAYSLQTASAIEPVAWQYRYWYSSGEPGVWLNERRNDANDLLESGVLIREEKRALGVLVTPNPYPLHD